VLARLRKEPAIVRALVVAVIDVLVVGGIVETGIAQEIEGIVLGLLNIAVGFQVRNRVTPV
jgi:hypothetical protein